MKWTMPIDLTEATRLTGEGRLSEATAAIQRMLQKGVEADTRTQRPFPDATSLKRADVVDVTPELIEAPLSQRTSSPGRSEADQKRGQSKSSLASPLPIPSRLRDLIG